MQDEILRLEALSSYHLLDTPPEPEFDDIVQIAQTLCDCPVALVSLVAEDRQWFKARIGFPSCETPLSQSVCIHALEEDEILVVPDLTRDPRTRENTLVTEAPRIRFYAGAVLRSPEGIAIGSLCVIDTQTRPNGLTQNQMKSLIALARQVMSLVNLRRATLARDEALERERERGEFLLDHVQSTYAVAQRVQTDQARQRQAQEAGGIGTFELDVTTDLCRMSAQACRLFGLDPAESIAIDVLQALVLPSDRTRTTTRESRVDGSAQRDLEFRIRRPRDGAVRWIHRRADFKSDPDGNIVAMIGIIQDITDRKLVDLRAGALITLGDALTGATTIEEIVLLASRTLGETLSVSRAAFAFVASLADHFVIEGEWKAPGVETIAGQRPSSLLQRSLDRLGDGAPLAIANVPAAAWLRDDRKTYEAAGVKAVINVPLMDRNRVIGVLFVHSTTPRTWSTGEIDFAAAVADRSYAAIAKVKAENHQHVLNEELSHRLKNTLALVQAIIQQTMRDNPDPEGVKALQERIVALSKAHDVLLQQSWSATSITSVVGQVLDLHDRRDQIDASGPDLKLGPRATLQITMLLHELATNAVKYGALSVPVGRVRVEWTVDGDGEPTLVLTWTERGGPAAQAPTRRGFGSRLIQMGLTGTGNSKLDYAPEGLRAVFRAPTRLVVAT